MFDRPTLTELLEAAAGHLSAQVLPAVRSDPKLYFQTLVAVNVLTIVERELKQGTDALRRAWADLNTLDGDTAPCPEDPAAARTEFDRRVADLCARIRAGEHDGEDHDSPLYHFLLAQTIRALEISNPRLLGAIASETLMNEH